MTKTMVATAEPDEIDVWLALDPETHRVTMQNREFLRHDFPPGLRGENWEQRKARISKALYDAIMTEDFGFEESDRIHRDLWSESGDTPWPGYLI